MNWKTGNPSKSGRYLCLVGTGLYAYFTTLPYSDRWKKWNVNDFNDANELNSAFEDGRVSAWTDQVEFIKQQGLGRYLEEVEE